MAAWSNAANLADGLDGLATGAAAMVFAAYAIVNIWQYSQSCVFGGPQCYQVRDPYDLAVVSLALAGACFGFLWWNSSPAKIFMGDTGSLAIGGALAALSVMTRTELLMVIVAGLFVIITASVVLQVGWFKISGGKRLFKMAPLQHHFELLGWQEVTITVRFWIICGMCVATGLGLFYAGMGGGAAVKSWLATADRLSPWAAGQGCGGRAGYVRLRRGGRGCSSSAPQCWSWTTR